MLNNIFLMVTFSYLLVQIVCFGIGLGETMYSVNRTFALQNPRNHHPEIKI